MSLDIKKVYVDTRWRTSDSKSSTDFSIELPRSFTIPDNVVAYIDDIVLPVSFPTVYDRNNALYFEYTIDITPSHDSIVLDTGNYTGQSFSAALKTKLSEWATSKFITPAPFDVIYDYVNNSIKITTIMANSALKIYSDDDLEKGNTRFPRMSKPKTLNKVLMFYKSTFIRNDLPLETFLKIQLCVA